MRGIQSQSSATRHDRASRRKTGSSMKKFAGIAVAVTLLSGFSVPFFSTPYVDSAGSLFGYQSATGPGKLERVMFSANVHTGAEKTQQFALYRCAELANIKAKPYFVIYESLTDAIQDRPAVLPRVGVLGNFPSASAFMLPLDEPRHGSKETARVLEELESLVSKYRPLPGRESGR